MQNPKSNKMQDTNRIQKPKADGMQNPKIYKMQNPKADEIQNLKAGKIRKLKPARDSRAYAVVFYGCTLVTLVLIGIMIFYPSGRFADDAAPSGSTTALPRTTYASTAPAAPPATTSAAPITTHVSLRWSQEQVRMLITQTLKDQALDIRLDEVVLAEPDQVQISGSITRAALVKMVEASDISSKDTLLFGLRLLPQNIDVKGSLRISMEDGALQIVPDSLTAAGIQVPAGLLPADLGSQLGDAVTEKLATEGCVLQELQIANGMLHLSCVLKK